MIYINQKNISKRILFILYALCKPNFKKDVKAVNRKKILRLKNGNGNNIRKHKVVKSQSQS